MEFIYWILAGLALSVFLAFGKIYFNFLKMRGLEKKQIGQNLFTAMPDFLAGTFPKSKFWLAVQKANHKRAKIP